MAEFLYGVNPTQADTTAQFTPGTEAADPRVRDFPGNIIRYVKAAGTIAANAAVRQDFTHADEPHAYLATSATGQIPVGVSLAALASSGTNQFGWITVHGKATVLTAAVDATGDLLVTTATAGTLDDLATNTDVTAGVIAAIAGVPIVALDTTAATDGTIDVWIG